MVTGALNLSIEMISVCATDGSITPLRFRLEDAEHRLLTVAIQQVVSSRPLQYVGVDMIQYLCKCRMDGCEKIFDIRYAVRAHQWTLFRVVQ